MDPANQFGRGTPAGKAIYRLYNKKSMDSTLDPELLARLQKMRKEKDDEAKQNTQPKPLPKSRAHVNVPKPLQCNGPTPEQIALHKLAQMGHRKRESIIRACVSSEPAALPPAPARPAITDADKERLCQIMEYGEELKSAAGASTGASGKTASYMRGGSTEDVFERRFDELTNEIAERKQFLAEMRAPNSTLGGKNPAERRTTEQRLMIEISDRISEMKEIDEKIRRFAAE